MRIAGFDFTGGACDFYRIVQPLQMIGAQKQAEVKIVRRGDGVEVFDEAACADAFYFGRPADQRLLDLIEKFKKADRFVAIDFDDDLFNISPWSPHYADHGVEEFSVTTKDGKHLPVWQDGVNINLAENRERAKYIAEAVHSVNLVTVTTRQLADVYAPLAKMVAIVPNSVDLNIWKPVKIHKNANEIRMGWAGGTSHLEDWGILEKVLPEIMENDKRIKLVILGTPFKQVLKEISENRIEVHPWVPIAAYPYKMALLNLDFCIIPLQDNPFNRCKSPIKWIEAAALGIPSVTSYVTPYKAMRRGDTGIFIAENSPFAWVEGVLKMAQDPILRTTMGFNAWEFVREEFNAERNSVLWLEAFEEARNARSKLTVVK